MATAESEEVHTQALGIVKGPGGGARETQMPVGGVLAGVAGLMGKFVLPLLLSRRVLFLGGAGSASATSCHFPPYCSRANSYAPTRITCFSTHCARNPDHRDHGRCSRDAETRSPPYLVSMVSLVRGYKTYRDQRSRSIAKHINGFGAMPGRPALTTRRNLPFFVA